MDFIKVILEYKRSKPAWVCRECDTENDCKSDCCLLCGHSRTGREWVIEAWNTEKKTGYVGDTKKDFRTNDGISGTGVNGGRINVVKKEINTWENEKKKSSFWIWLIIGAALLLTFLVLAIAYSIYFK